MSDFMDSNIKCDDWGIEKMNGIEIDSWLYGTNG